MCVYTVESACKAFCEIHAKLGEKMCAKVVCKKVKNVVKKTIGRKGMGLKVYLIHIITENRNRRASGSVHYLPSFLLH